MRPAHLPLRSLEGRCAQGLAGTVADLAGSQAIGVVHLAEAMQFRRALATS